MNASDDDPGLLNDIAELRRAVEAVTDIVEGVRRVQTEQTAEIIRIINLLMARVDEAARGNVQTDNRSGGDSESQSGRDAE